MNLREIFLTRRKIGCIFHGHERKFPAKISVYDGDAP